MSELLRPIFEEANDTNELIRQRERGVSELPQATTESAL
jgi:hypothetical protein